jgi:hypothetical protein
MVYDKIEEFKIKFIEYILEYSMMELLGTDIIIKCRSYYNEQGIEGETEYTIPIKDFDINYLLY